MMSIQISINHLNKYSLEWLHKISLGFFYFAEKTAVSLIWNGCFCSIKAGEV